MWARPCVGWKDGMECDTMWLGADWEDEGACIEAARPSRSGDESDDDSARGTDASADLGACMDSDKAVVCGGFSEETSSNGGGGFRGIIFGWSKDLTGFGGSEG